MEAALARKIEKNVERAASAMFAAACGYAAYVWFSPLIAQPILGAETGGAAAFAYLCCSRTLRMVGPSSSRIPVPVFDLRDYEVQEEIELLLTDRVQPADEPLVLDDILAELAPDSRVVRLFDPAAMPTPAQLKSRIDDHLRDRSSAAENSDAAQALHDALAQLRRSIR